MKRKLHFARQRLRARKARRNGWPRMFVAFKGGSTITGVPGGDVGHGISYERMHIWLDEVAPLVQQPPVFKGVQLADNWPREDLPRTPPAN